MCSQVCVCVGVLSRSRQLPGLGYLCGALFCPRETDLVRAFAAMRYSSFMQWEHM